MTRLILFIVSGMLLYSTGAIADIILKDCYSPKFSKSFDKNEYEYHYYKIDEKNKSITLVWSFTNKEWSEKARFIDGAQKNSVVNYLLTFSDKNIIQGIKKGDYTNEEIILELNTGVVKHQSSSKDFRFPPFYKQCKNK